jgi:putative acetyltransferase
MPLRHLSFLFICLARHGRGRRGVCGFRSLGMFPFLCDGQIIRQKPCISLANYCYTLARKLKLMITIRPIRVDEIAAAKHIIHSVAYHIYGWSGSLEDSIRHFESTGEFADMDQVETHYFQNDGLFLAVLDDDTLIGSGALQKMDSETAELKRMWLLESHHGRGIGYQVIKRLFEFARTKGYSRVRLQTGIEQTRAYRFYKKLGFYEIASYNDNIGEISMEINLQGINLPQGILPQD